MSLVTHGSARKDLKILVFNNVKCLMATISILVESLPMWDGCLNIQEVSFPLINQTFNYLQTTHCLAKYSNVAIWPSIFVVRGSDRCKLFCRVQDSSTYYLLNASVIDGTPCGADTFDACVSGQCIPAGCDHILGSGMKLGSFIYLESYLNILCYHWAYTSKLFYTPISLWSKIGAEYVVGITQHAQRKKECIIEQYTDIILS